MDGETQDYNVRLLGNVCLARRQTVKLTTDEEFDKLEGNLTVMEQTVERRQDDGSVGTISYCEEMKMPDMYSKANYTLHLHLPKPRFEVLLAAVARGQMPSEMWVEVDGMEYDWQPDGSGKKWDNKTSPRLAIKSINFIVPLVGADPQNFLDDRSPEDGMPPSRAQVNQVMSGLNQLLSKLESIQQVAQWLLILFAVFAVTFLWHYYR